MTQKALFSVLFVFLLLALCRCYLIEYEGSAHAVVTAFQVILLIVILIGFLGAVGEEKDKDLSNNLAFLCVSGMIAFIISVLWF